MKRDLRKRKTCRWCGLDGHRLDTCWVRAERRPAPDEHDVEAAEIAARLGADVSLVELRRVVSRALRRAARRARAS